MTKQRRYELLLGLAEVIEQQVSGSLEDAVAWQQQNNLKPDELWLISQYAAQALRTAAPVDFSEFKVLEGGRVQPFYPARAC